ncbi:MAG: radical SAM protein [Verrucomicrobiales bacterium]|nr:radical SAM protein [Verrucomicrobiales bacterium]
MLSPSLPKLHDERVLKLTTSRCPTCLRACPAEVVRIGSDPGRVVLRRTCPDHGLAVATLATDARFYWLSKGDPANASCGCDGGACRASDDAPSGTLGRNAAGRGQAPFESLATCLALIEVVDSCNLACPTCYANSPVGTGARLQAPPLAELQARITGILERKGGIEILQLSGGEPTLHPQFFELLDWTLAHPKIDHVLLNTNGVLLARDDAFLERLRTSLRPGRLQLYLQFDGPQAAAQIDLRGTDLRELRLRTLERTAAIGLPVTLAMTVTHANLPHVWETIAFGLRWPHVRGVTFQPEFRSGRSPRPAPLSAITPSTPPTPATSDRLNSADILLAAVEQSDGQLSTADFTPLPCGDPNCAIIGYLLKLEGQIRPVSEFVDFAHIQGFLRDRLQFRPEDLSRCGCESEPLGQLLHRFELDASHTFRMVIKPFMDAWTWDQDRIDRCCTHVIRPDGKLDSFCRYYSGFPDTHPPA